MKKTCFLALAIISLSCHSEAGKLKPVVVALEAEKDAAPREFGLLSNYKMLSDKEREKVELVYQGQAKIMTYDEDKFLVTGPLCPCIGIVIHTSKGTMLAHYDVETNIESIFPMITQLIKDCGKKIKITLLTKEIDGFDEIRDGLGKSSYAKKFGYKTQEKVCLYLSDLFKVKLKIKNVDYVVLPKEDYPDADLGDYLGANAWIVVDRNGEIYSTSCYKEKLFENIEEFVLRKKPREDLRQICNLIERDDLSVQLTDKVIFQGSLNECLEEKFRLARTKCKKLSTKKFDFYE
jgi:hypothetical protein